MKKYYKEIKHFPSDCILLDLLEFEDQIYEIFIYSEHSVYFEVYRKDEENQHEAYDIAIGNWLVSHGAEYGESVYID